MNQPILRPPRAPQEAKEEPSSQTDQPASAYPKAKKGFRPGWKATLVRKETFDRLKAIQKSTTDPTPDMSYLTDACVQIALERGPEEVVKRVFDSFCRPRKTD